MTSRKRKYYTIDLCSGKVNMYSSLEEANEKEGYVHPDDTYPTLISALEAIKKHTQEDLEYNTKEYKQAFFWAAKDQEILKQVDKRIRETLTGRSRNGSKR